MVGVKTVRGCGQQSRGLGGGAGGGVCALIVAGAAGTATPRPVKITATSLLLILYSEECFLCFVRSFESVVNE